MAVSDIRCTKTLQWSCLIKPTLCAKHALCVVLLSRTYFSMWGHKLEKCLVKSTIQHSASHLTWHWRQHVKHWVSCDFFLCTLQKLLRLYLYVRMIVNGRLQWEFLIMSVSIAAVTETFSYAKSATDGYLESAVLSPAVYLTLFHRRVLKYKVPDSKQASHLLKVFLVTWQRSFLETLAFSGLCSSGMWCHISGKWFLTLRQCSSPIYKDQNV